MCVFIFTMQLFLFSLVNKSQFQCKTFTKLVTVHLCLSSGKCGEDQRHAGQRCV